MIYTEKLSLTYDQANVRVQALENINLKLEQGSSMSIIGPSGCGKSSLLFVLAGLRPPTGGIVTVSGRTPVEHQRDTALILQDYGLFPWKTVMENAALGLTVRGLNTGRQQDIVRPILERLNLSELVDHYPAQLSGGQKQRVAIARSLALNPKLLLMDEPLSSLDALTRESLQQFILEIWKEHRLTLVLVTHSIEEAVFLGRRIIVMSERPGAILETIENPLMGTRGFRQNPEFYNLCSKLRQLLGVDN